MWRRGALFVVAILLAGSSSDAAWKFNPFTGKQDYYEASGSVSDNSITNAKINSAAGIAGTKLQYKMDQSVRTTDSPTFAGLTLNGPLVSGTADNTHSGNVMNTASPTGTNLAAGNYWTLKDETLRLRNQDNSATNVLASAYQYRDFAFDNSAMDNMALIQNLPFDEVWDNVIYTVRGYVDGKATEANTDNVTTNFYCCDPANTLAQCTAMFSSAPVPRGDITLTPAIDSGTCAAGKEIRISFSEINLSGKKLNIRERHLRR